MLLTVKPATNNFPSLCKIPDIALSSPVLIEVITLPLFPKLKSRLPGACAYDCAAENIKKNTSVFLIMF